MGNAGLVTPMLLDMLSSDVQQHASRYSSNWMNRGTTSEHGFEFFHFYETLNGYFSLDPRPCCGSSGGFGRRSIQDWGIAERQASGETEIPGTNTTVQDIVDSIDFVTERVGEVKVTIEFEPSQSAALAECVDSGLCT